MAFVLTALAGIPARGAITFDTDPNSNRALARWLSSGIVVDLNRECHTMPLAGWEDQQRPEMPYLSPEDLECAETARATESGDFSDTNAADDGDYMEYKYGHYGRNFGGSSYQNPTPAQSSDDANRDDYSTQADDPNNAENTAAADENPSQGTTEDGADLDPGMTPGYEKYDRYRYMTPEEQVGRNEGAMADDDEDNSTSPKDGVAEQDEGDDTCMADDESGESGLFTDAMLTIASQMANEWTGRYGMKFSDIGRLLGWNN
jgi:hypothetical protein